MSSAGSNPTHPDPWRLDGRSIMVSGSAGGIGRSVVEVLCAAGARLSLCDLAVGEEPPSGSISTTGDLTDPATARRWATRTIDAFGRIDGLVNVAGAWRSTPFEQITPDELATMMAINFSTMWHACQAVVPAMTERRRGSIVNFASTAGQFGSIRPGAHYAAAKGAVIALTKTLARELSPSGIRVNAISPGPVDTSDAGSGVDFDDAEVRARTLLGRVGRPDEIAHGVLYLVSDASTYATGSLLCVNGGSQL